VLDEESEISEQKPSEGRRKTSDDPSDGASTVPGKFSRRMFHDHGHELHLVSLSTKRLLCEYNGPTKTLGEIERSTFCPSKFRIRVRVLDVLPEVREDIFRCQRCDLR
jgi:hypothetical protein